MKKTCLFLEKNIKTILLLFLILQPIIDLMTSVFLNVWELNITFGMITRVAFLIFLSIYFLLVVKTKQKKGAIIYLCTLVTYMLLFILEIYFLKDKSVIPYEFKNMVRCFYFPIYLILLFCINESKKIVIDSKILVRILYIYIILILIPMITNTSFNGYTEGKIGVIGWFNSTNEISAIFSLCLPFYLVSILSKKTLLSKLIQLVVLVVVLFQLGSKIVILALILTVIFIGVQYILELNKKKRRQAIAFLSVIFVIAIVIMSFLLPKTSFYKNMKTHLEFLNVKSITDIVTDPKIIDRFIFSDRLTFLNKTRNNYNESTYGEKVLGIGYIEKYSTDQVNTKLIEMDPFDILYRHGVIGFILYFIPILFIAKECLQYSTINKKNKRERLAYFLSFGLIWFMVLVTGHVFTAPAVATFVGIVFLQMYNKRAKDNTKIYEGGN